MKYFRFLISGRVQGVFYRVKTVQYVKKNQLKIVGHVKNLIDGRVEVIAFGDVIDLQLLTDWLKKGPPMAQIDEIIKEEMFDHCSCSDFNVVY